MLQRVVLSIMGFTRRPQIVRSGWFIKRWKMISAKIILPTGEILDIELNGEIIGRLPVQFKSHHIKTQSGFNTF